jgi:hypothetical protein
LRGSRRAPLDTASLTRAGLAAMILKRGEGCLYARKPGYRNQRLEL